jgi:uncharacterized protein YihD (DUF1040 family)
MRDPKRIDRILKLLREIWDECPDLRLGQMIYNATKASKNKDIFYLEDNDLEDFLFFLLGTLKQQKKLPKTKNLKMKKLFKDLKIGEKMKIGGENYEKTKIQ